MWLNWLNLDYWSILWRKQRFDYETAGSSESLFSPKICLFCAIQHTVRENIKCFNVAALKQENNTTSLSQSVRHWTGKLVGLSWGLCWFSKQPSWEEQQRHNLSATTLGLWLFTQKVSVELLRTALSAVSIQLQGTHLWNLFPNQLCRIVAFKVLYLQTLKPLKPFRNILYWNSSCVCSSIQVERMASGQTHNP